MTAPLGGRQPRSCLPITLWLGCMPHCCTCWLHAKKLAHVSLMRILPPGPSTPTNQPHVEPSRSAVHPPTRPAFAWPMPPTACPILPPCAPPRAVPCALWSLQDSSGVSRDEMAEALMEVSEGRIPSDRIALRELCKEMQAWPSLDELSSEWSGREGRGGAVWSERVLRSEEGGQGQRGVQSGE